MKNNYLFYPVSQFDEERYEFDDSSDDAIIDALRNEQDIKIIQTDTDVEYEADLFNDWDDCAEDWLIDECSAIIEGYDIDSDFVKSHWCVAVTDNVAKALKNN